MKIQRDGKEYTLTAEEVMEAHEEFVTSFMAAELEDSYDIPHKYSKDLAKEAYDIYADSGNYSEYDCIERVAEEIRTNGLFLLNKLVPYLRAHEEISDKSVTVHVLFDKPSVEIESWKEKYLIDFDNYVSECRYCLNSGLDLPDEPMIKDYDPALIAERQKIEEELKQEAAAAGMTVEEYAANDFISPKQQTTNKKATKKQPTL